MDKTPPNEGDIALAKSDYDAALTFFRERVSKDPASEDAHLGLVRALIGKNLTEEALKESAVAIAKAPKSAVAEVAAGEASYRAADFISMRQHAAHAAQLNPCEGRAAALAARLFAVNALFATEAGLLRQAHQLRPNDAIRREWILSLPRKEREAELGKYLAETSALSTKERAGLVDMEEHLKAHRGGECRITSKSETVKIPFSPIFEDQAHIRAYGLDIYINGKMRRMQIDTGASGITFALSAAKRLGLTPEYHIHATGVGDEGEVDSYLTHVASIKIGDVEVSDCMVEVLGKSKLDVDGLIGIDVFDRWLVTLDYQSALLLLNPLPLRPGENRPAALNDATAQSETDDTGESVPHDAIVPPEMKDWLHVIRIGHELLLPAIVNNGPLHYMMADTGASLSSLSLPVAQEAGKTRHDRDMEITGISGNVKKSFKVDNVKLQFGSLRLPPTSYTAFDITGVSHNTGVEVSGFVGLPTLSRLSITIDYRDNLMEMKYDPNHDKQQF